MSIIFDKRKKTPEDIALMNYSSFQKQFPDEDSCIEYLAEHNLKPCPCGSTWKRRKNRPSYTCTCGKEWHVRTGTMFQKSHVPIRDWFFAVFLFSNSKNGVSAKELERQLGVSYPTALRMSHIIRKCMVEKVEQNGTVEADETAIGGRRRGTRGRGAKKHIVLGTVERGGKIKMSVIRNIKAKSMIKHFKDLPEGTQLMTDELRSYKFIARTQGLKQSRVKHASYEWTREDCHINTIEVHWAHLKRMIEGTHNHVSYKYLPLYVAERCFSYNHRHDDRFSIVCHRLCVRDRRRSSWK